MIGVFDSGVGGLTVVKEIFKTLPGCQIIYFGDTARLPYGTKGADFVRRYSEKISKWLLKSGAKAIVIACHTSSAWAADFLKRKFKNVPIFEMIEPAAREAVKSAKNKKIGMIGTPGTIKSGSWKKKILELSPDSKIYLKSCPLLVPLIEEGWIEDKITKEVAEKYLEDMKKQRIEVLILACTHYPILKKTIKNIMGKKVKIINPAESLAKELKNFLAKNGKSGFTRKGIKSNKFFFSDEPYNLEKISHLCLGKKIKAKIKDPF